MTCDLPGMGDWFQPDPKPHPCDDGCDIQPTDDPSVDACSVCGVEFLIEEEAA